MHKKRKRPKLIVSFSGEEGIRTLETLSSLHTFQACQFNHSCTSPVENSQFRDAKIRFLPTIPKKSPPCFNMAGGYRPYYGFCIRFGFLFISSCGIKNSFRLSPLGRCWNHFLVVKIPKRIRSCRRWPSAANSQPSSSRKRP